MKQRGFTIVELLVVMVVIAILAAVVTNTYRIQQDNAVTSQARSLANAIKTGGERYFNTNNEYPLAASVTTHATAGTVLGISKELLDGQHAKFLHCSGVTNCVSDQSKVYYVTKAASQTAANYILTVAATTTSPSCSFTFPATEVSGGAFLIVYWSRDKDTWLYNRSNNGNLTTSNATTCPFTSS